MRAQSSTPARPNIRDSPITPVAGTISQPTAHVNKPASLDLNIIPPVPFQQYSHRSFIDTSSECDLQTENSALKKELEKIQLERHMVLDHSIKSDIRL